MAEHERKRLADMSDDKVFIDLILFARERIGMATHDSLSRFRWADYTYSQGVAACSYVLCKMLATVNREIKITPDELAYMVQQELIETRKEKDEEED